MLLSSSSLSSMLRKPMPLVLVSSKTAQSSSLLSLLGKNISTKAFSSLTGSKVLSTSTNMTLHSKPVSSSLLQQKQQQQYRYISIGTDMRLPKENEVLLQKARPWYNNDTEGSNKASDNVLSCTDIFPIDKTIVLFGVPAPFTGICTSAHFPPYKQLATEIKTKYNVHAIYCYSVSDPYSMYNWSKQNLQNNINDIRMICDDTDTYNFAKYYKLDTNYSAVSLGNRSIRFSMIVQNGIVVAFNKITSNPENDATTIIQQLQSLSTK